MLYLFKFLAITVLVVVILGFLSRFLLAYFLRRLSRKFGGQQNAGKRRREGEVNIETNPRKGKIMDDKVGDYIDYEEVDGEK